MSFGDDVLSGKIIHRQHFEPLPRGYAANGGINGRGCPGQQFIQGISFFFGHSIHIVLFQYYTEAENSKQGWLTQSRRVPAKKTSQQEKGNKYNGK
jgi:hypothetical protein